MCSLYGAVPIGGNHASGCLSSRHGVSPSVHRRVRFLARLDCSRSGLSSGAGSFPHLLISCCFVISYLFCSLYGSVTTGKYQAGHIQKSPNLALLWRGQKKWRVLTGEFGENGGLLTRVFGTYRRTLRLEPLQWTSSPSLTLYRNAAMQCERSTVRYRVREKGCCTLLPFRICISLTRVAWRLSCLVQPSSERQRMISSTHDPSTHDHLHA